MQTWIQGINASTVCTTRAHGSARATMYSRSDAHSIERGTTYSTCVHSTKLDAAYTQPGRSWYEPRYQLRNSHTGYRLRYRLHTIRPELVLSTIPRTQHMHMVPILVPPMQSHNHLVERPLPGLWRVLPFAALGFPFMARMGSPACASAPASTALHPMIGVVSVASLAKMRERDCADQNGGLRREAEQGT